MLEQVSGQTQMILKAVNQLCDEAKVEKTGLGKRGDPHTYALVEDGTGTE